MVSHGIPPYSSFASPLPHQGLPVTQLRAKSKKSKKAKDADVASEIESSGSDNDDNNNFDCRLRSITDPNSQHQAAGGHGLSASEARQYALSGAKPGSLASAGAKPSFEERRGRAPLAMTRGMQEQLSQLNPRVLIHRRSLETNIESHQRARYRHLGLMTTVFQRCLLQGDLPRAHRAFTLILAITPGLRIPIRDRLRSSTYWGLASELIMLGIQSQPRRRRNKQSRQVPSRAHPGAHSQARSPWAASRGAELQFSHDPISTSFALADNMASNLTAGVGSSADDAPLDHGTADDRAAAIRNLGAARKFIEALILQFPPGTRINHRRADSDDNGNDSSAEPAAVAAAKPGSQDRKVYSALRAPEEARRQEEEQRARDLAMVRKSVAMRGTGSNANALDFYPALFSVWIAELVFTLQAGADGDGDEDHEDNDDDASMLIERRYIQTEQALARVQAGVEGAITIAGRIDRVLNSVEYVLVPELLRLRGDVELWTHQLEYEQHSLATELKQLEDAIGGGDNDDNEVDDGGPMPRSAERAGQDPDSLFRAIKAAGEIRAARAEYFYKLAAQYGMDDLHPGRPPSPTPTPPSPRSPGGTGGEEGNGSKLVVIEESGLLSFAAMTSSAGEEESDDDDDGEGGAAGAEPIGIGYSSDGFASRVVRAAPIQHPPELLATHESIPEEGFGDDSALVSAVMPSFPVSFAGFRYEPESEAGLYPLPDDGFEGEVEGEDIQTRLLSDSMMEDMLEEAENKVVVDPRAEPDAREHNYDSDGDYKM